MKKFVLLLALAVLVISCDIPQGGNKGRIKKTDDIVRYDDPGAPQGTYKPSSDSTKISVKDSVKTKTPIAEVPKTKH